jgi:hypothetical protein
LTHMPPDFVNPTRQDLALFCLYIFISCRREEDGKKSISPPHLWGLDYITPNL